MQTEHQENGQSIRFHPLRIFMYLLLAGVTMLFLAFTAAYMYSRFWASDGAPPIHLPKIFVFNSLLMVASSYALRRAKTCYLQDETTGYQNALLITTILTVAFMLLQIVGWRQLFGQDMFLTSSTLTSYLYVLSVLHFMHVLAGLPFLVMFYLSAKKRMKEPVSVLVYFSDPVKRLKLRLLSIYWHFLDGLWIYLVLFFLLNSIF